MDAPFALFYFIFISTYMFCDTELWYLFSECKHLEPIAESYEVNIVYLQYNCGRARPPLEVL